MEVKCVGAKEVYVGVKVEHVDDTNRLRGVNGLVWVTKV